VNPAAAIFGLTALAIVGYYVATVYGERRRETDATDEVYGHEAEGDFAHNPKFTVVPDIDGVPALVIVECSLGDYSHLQPVTRSVAAARLAADAEFWITHNEEMRAA
jgi:hypothetical protein